jgi:epoxyqueuosine reductase
MSDATSTQLDPHQLAATIKQRARELGFGLVGIAPASPSKYRAYLRQWLDDGQAGTMGYLASRFEERADPGTYVPGAASVICVAMNYHVRLEPPERRADQANGKIARYALGDDYHEVIKDRLHALADWIRQASPCTTRAAVDTAPVMEKEMAARAGIGWLGKNTCVINERIGSWLLLGEIVTTLVLPADQPAIDRCGTCRRCIDACPTGAITAPYQLDARKCISYLTIEHRGEVDPALQPLMGDWLYGCDICQDVCPFNGKAPESDDPVLRPRFASGTLDVQEVQKWTPDDYSQALRHSAMKRVKLPQLKRNATIVFNNSQGGLL